MATKKSSSKITEASSVALFNKLKRQQPLLTSTQVDAIERIESDTTMHAWRRAALASLQMSGQELLAKIEGDREAAVVFTHMAIGIRGYVEHQEKLLQWLKTASSRIELLSCVRDDWDEVRAAARKSYAEDANEARHG